MMCYWLNRYIEAAIIFWCPWVLLLELPPMTLVEFEVDA